MEENKKQQWWGENWSERGRRLAGSVGDRERERSRVERSRANG